MILKQNQSALDFATQTSGDLKSLIDFCLLNGLSITEEIQAGTEVSVPETEHKNEIIADYFESKNIELSTSSPRAISIILGIGTMTIGSDFDVL